MRRVLVAMDESVESVRAARAGVDLFGSDPEFLLVNVARVPVAWAGGFGDVDALPAFDWVALTEQTDRAAEVELRASAEEAGIPAAEVLVEHGETVGVISAAAEEHDVDVIVVGSHDKGLLVRLFSPSVADRLVHTTHRPVLVVSGTPIAP